MTTTPSTATAAATASASASSTAPAALEAERLTKRYRPGRPLALDSIDLRVPPGSVVALVGPNGAGKSTLIRCFLGFERPNSGRVLVTGIDPRRDRVAALGRVGYVGQQPGLYRDLSADEHLELAETLRRGEFDRAGATERLDGLGITRSVVAGQLSGGQQAQVALTIALGTQAPVLLLDEPLASLDPLARRDFLAIVRGVAAAGTTVLFASHLVGDLEVVCDRLVVLAPARVMLDTTIAAARTSHSIVPLADVASRDLVGAFDDHVGRPQALVRSTSGDGSISLDDIVLGYLAAARDRRAVAA